MPGLIHSIDLLDKLKDQSHLFVPSTQWDRASIASALQIINILRHQKRSASILAPMEWKSIIPAHWPKQYFIFAEGESVEIEKRPDWVWLWGMGYAKEHTQNLKNFLIGCDTIQVLDWTQSKYRKWGDFVHPVAYMGGLPEFSYNISRNLLPFEKWPKHFLFEAFEDLFIRYPFLCLDTPLSHLMGRLSQSSEEEIQPLEKVELFNKTGLWYTFTTQSEQPDSQLHESIQQHYFQHEAEHALYLISKGGNRYSAQIFSPDHILELITREKCVKNIKVHSSGYFEIEDIEPIIELLPQNDDFEGLTLTTWAKPIYEGEHFSIHCNDPSWESEKERRLNALARADEEELQQEEEEDEEELLEKMDWNSTQLLNRVQSLRPLPVKLKALDFKEHHLPVVRLTQEQTQSFYQDKLDQYNERLRLIQEKEEERLAKEQAEREEQERLEREQAEREEQERLEKEQAEREEQERLEREQAEREEQERLEKEQAEREEQERLEKEQAEREEQERLEKELAEREEQERLEKEQAEREEQERLEKEQEEREEQEREQTELEELEREEAERFAALEKEEESAIPDYLHSEKDSWGSDDEELEEDEEYIYQDQHSTSSDNEQVDFPSYDEYMEAFTEHQEENENVDEEALKIQQELDQIDEEHDSDPSIKEVEDTTLQENTHEANENATVAKLEQIHEDYPEEEPIAATELVEKLGNIQEDASKRDDMSADEIIEQLEPIASNSTATNEEKPQDAEKIIEALESDNKNLRPEETPSETKKLIDEIDSIADGAEIETADAESKPEEPTPLEIAHQDKPFEEAPIIEEKTENKQEKVQENSNPDITQDNTEQLEAEAKEVTQEEIKEAIADKHLQEESKTKTKKKKEKSSTKEVPQTSKPKKRKKNKKSSSDQEDFIRYDWDKNTSTQLILKQVRNPKRLMKIDFIYLFSFVLFILFYGVHYLSL